MFRAGRTTTVTIPVTPDVAQAMVKVTGTVRVPSGWKEGPDWVTIEGAEESNAEVRETIHFARARAEGDAPRSVRFTTPAIPAGLYLVEIEP